MNGHDDDDMTAESEEDDEGILQRYVNNDCNDRCKLKRSLERNGGNASYGLRQLALCRYLRELMKENDYREIFEVLEDPIYDINVLHGEFFDIFEESSDSSSDNDEENSHVLPEILNLLVVKMMCLDEDNLRTDIPLDIVGNCLKFIDLGIKWMGVGSESVLQVINSTLHVLHRAMKENVIDFTSDARLECFLTKVNDHHPEPTSLFYILKATLFFAKYPGDDTKLGEALQMIREASRLCTPDLDIKDQCLSLTNKIKSKLREKGSTSLSRNETPEREGSRTRGGRRRKKKKRAVDEEKDDSDQVDVNGVNGAERSAFPFEINIGGSGEMSESAKKVFDNFSITKFMEDFSHVPPDTSAVYDSIKAHDLSALSPTEVPLLEALWSVIQSQSWMHKRWKLENISMDEFKHKFERKLNSEASESTTLQLLNLIADEYLVKILVFSLFSPLIPILKILPSKASHLLCLHLLHTRQGKFVGLGKGDGSQLPNFTTSNHSSRGGFQAVNEKVSDAVARLVEQVSHLEVRAEEVIVEGRNNRKNIYQMLTRPELEEKLKSHPASHRICKLKLQGPHEGIAEPLDDRKTATAPPEASILLRGRRSCGIAFDGDHVVVEVFRKQDRVESGRVIGVWSSCVRPVNQVFFCKVSKDQTNLMRPLCGTFPKIHVNNQQAQETYKRERLPRAEELLNFRAQEGSATRNEKARAEAKFANRSMVSVFNMTVTNGVPHLQPRGSQEVHPLTCEDIFVVLYKKWDRKYLYPYGHVIGILKSDLSAPDEAAIRRILCGLPQPHDPKTKSSAEARRLCTKLATKVKNATGREDYRAMQTFTIDNEKREGLDNAISFKKEDGIQQIFVHFIDVSHFVAPGSDLDLEARRRGFTISGRRISDPVPLLPPALTKKLSFEVGQERLCLSFILRFNESGLIPAEKDFVSSVVKLDMKLLAADVWEAVRGAASADNWHVASLKEIYRCTERMREARLKEKAKVKEHAIGDIDNIGKRFPTDVILEELMVEVNHRVAQFLSKFYCGPSIRRRNLKPLDSKVEEWLKSYKKIIPHSGTLKHRVRCLKQDARILPDSDSCPPPVLVNSDMKQHLEVAIQKGNLPYALDLLSSERLHPQLFLAIQSLSALSMIAEYEVWPPEMEQRGRTPTVSHHGLDMDTYVHFTAPLHRYVDIVTHRLFRAAERNARETTYTEEDLQLTVTDCNRRIAEYRRFKRFMSVYKLYRRAAQKPLNLACVVSAISPSGILLDHHFLKKLPEHCRSLRFAQMHMNQPPKLDEKDGGALRLECEFKLRLFILDPGARDAHPHRRLPFHEFDYCVRNLEQHFALMRLKKSWGSLTALQAMNPLELERFFKKLEFQPHFPLDTADTCSDVTSEVNAQQGPRASRRQRRVVLDTGVTFSFRLLAGDSLRCQFHAPEGQTKLRSPKLAFVRISPSVGICLEHQEDPARCFGAEAVEAIPEVPRDEAWPDVAHFVAFWLALVRREAICESLGDRSSYHIRDVPVAWMRGPNGAQLGGVLKIDLAFCQNLYRQISMESEGALSDCYDELSMSLQYLCVKVPLDDYTWIGHGGVKFRCDVSSTAAIVFFDIQHQSNPFPEEIVKKQKLADIEFINKTFPIRYQERALRSLATLPESSLAVHMALGDFRQQIILPLLEVLNQDSRLRTTEYEQACNKEQKKAITNAFVWEISLIWGPPGTGKSQTGVQIAFWFAIYNRLHQPDLKDDGDDNAELKVHNPPQKLAKDDDGYQIVKRRERRPRVDRSREGRYPKSPSKTTEPTVYEVVQLDVVQLFEGVLPLGSRRRQVLCCGPSNTCVNTFAERLLLKAPEGISVVRVFSQQVERKNFPLPGVKNSGSLIDSDVEVPQNLRGISLHFLIRKDGRPYAESLRKYDKLFRRAQEYLDGGRPLVIKFSDEDEDHFDHYQFLVNLRRAVKMYQNIVAVARGTELRNYDIVLCTTAVSANSGIQQHCRFCQVIIDEAGMCTEPETLVPLVPNGIHSASAALESAVLIGDHKQLRPIIFDDVAGELGLSRSMMERHWIQEDKFGNRVMLKDQYRMHPTICDFPSRDTYSKELKTCESPSWKFMLSESETNHLDLEEKKALRKNGNYDILLDRWPLCAQNPHLEERVVFLHVEGEEKSLVMTSREGSENSRSNFREACLVTKLYARMRDSYTPRRRALSGIAALSQYQHQVHLIRDELMKELAKEGRGGASRQRNNRRAKTMRQRFEEKNDRFRRPPSPFVTSVIRSQGSEFDYVILSTVRSLPKHDIEDRPTPGWERKYLGFITDENQVNVALTRARKGLIIVGNGNLLQVHSFWKRLIADLRHRGCYFDTARAFAPL